MGQGVVNRHIGQAGRGATPEWPATGRQHHPRHLALGIDRRTQALVHSAVLAVDRHELGARRRSQRLHHGPGSDQALFVRQRQSLAATQGGNRDRQAGKADDGVDHDVGVIGQVTELGDHVCERQRVGDASPLIVVGNGDDLRPELERLLDEHVDRRSDAQTDDLEAIGLGAHDVEGLGADAAAAAGNRDSHRGHGLNCVSRTTRTRRVVHLTTQLCRSEPGQPVRCAEVAMGRDR
jgi:hypothetical protein